MKSKHILAAAVIVALSAVGGPAMAVKSHTLKLKPTTMVTVRIHCINSYLRRNERSKVKFTRIAHNWLYVAFKSDMSDSDVKAIFDAAKGSCGVE